MEIVDFFRIVFALVAVVGMIGLAALAAKRLGLANGVLANGRPRRLALVESLSLDPKRRAAILSCDGREHLIILDPSRVTVVEQGLPPRSSDDAVEFDEAPPLKKLGVPASVVRLLHRAPRDEATKFRAAGVL